MNCSANRFEQQCLVEQRSGIYHSSAQLGTERKVVCSPKEQEGKAHYCQPISNLNHSAIP